MGPGDTATGAADDDDDDRLAAIPLPPDPLSRWLGRPAPEDGDEVDEAEEQAAGGDE